jgi:S-(hydroxymethyl)glutathione dehydrogenase/alcohol dehydrogenase
VLPASDQPLVLEELTFLELEPDEVVVRITASDICHSDLHAVHGAGPFPPPIVLGHEGTGLVEEVGRGVRSVKKGDRVVCSWVSACGACWFCAQGEAHLCRELEFVYTEPKLRRPDGSLACRMTGVGSFAEAAVLREQAAIKVETDLPDEHLALIGCGITTGVCAVLNTARVRPGSTVTVLGCGGVGQSAIQGARIAGAAQIIAVDPVELKRSTALTLGATQAIDPGAVDPVEETRALTGGRGADYAFETAGLSPTLAQGYDLIRRGGTLITVGVQAPSTAIPWPAITMFADEKKVLGCFYGSAQMRRDVPMLTGLVEARKLDLASMVSRRYALDDVNDGLAAIESGEVIRSVIINS